MAKRKFRNITVCVTPEVYRQARHLAAEYDTTVSAIVASLLLRLPDAMKRTNFPKGGPKHAPQTASASPNQLAAASAPNRNYAPATVPACDAVTPHPTQIDSAVSSQTPRPVTAPVHL